MVTDIPDLKIVLVGSGSLSAWLEQQVNERKLHNVLLAGRLPVTQMPALYALSQALLVTLRDEVIFTYTVPSKVQGYLAAGRPILAAINGETANILHESGAGLATAAEDAESLAQNIRKIYHLPIGERVAMGMRGRDYFREHFEMDSQIANIVDLLQQRISTR